MKVYCYEVTDSNGDTIADVCLDPCDPINVGGVDKSGKYHQFDTTEAYHVYEWAKQYGFSVEMKGIDILDIALGNG
jgi:hypothetical protein